MNYPYKPRYWETKDHKKNKNKRYGNFTYRKCY